MLLGDKGPGFRLSVIGLILLGGGPLNTKTLPIGDLLLAPTLKLLYGHYILEGVSLKMSFRTGNLVGVLFFIWAKFKASLLVEDENFSRASLDRSCSFEVLLLNLRVFSGE